MGKRIRIPVERLTVGARVTLPVSWLHHPFARSSFTIGSEEQIRRIREAGFEWVYADSAGEESGDGGAAQLTEATQQIVAILESEEVEPEEKARRVYGLTASVVSAVFDAPTPENILVASGLAKALAEAVSRDEAIAGNLALVSSFDRRTYEHSVRVGCLAICLATRIWGVAGSGEVAAAAPGFLLHDIGKVTLPLDLLNKAGPLSPTERSLMQRHTTQGHRILSERPELDPVCAQIALQHHERAGGTGYPSGLRGDEIEPFARVCSVADVFDALTGPRPYRKVFRPHDALALMRREMLHHFQREFLAEFVLLLGERRAA